MKILVINCGSSSLKYQLIDMDNELSLIHISFPACSCCPTTSADPTQHKKRASPPFGEKRAFCYEKEKIVHQHLILGLLVCHGLAGHDHRLRAGKPSCVHDNHSCFLLNAFLRKVFTQAMTATTAMPMITAT